MGYIKEKQIEELLRRVENCKKKNLRPIDDPFIQGILIGHNDDNNWVKIEKSADPDEEKFLADEDEEDTETEAKDSKKKKKEKYLDSFVPGFVPTTFRSELRKIDPDKKYISDEDIEDCYFMYILPGETQTDYLDNHLLQYDPGRGIPFIPYLISRIKYFSLSYYTKVVDLKTMTTRTQREHFYKYYNDLKDELTDTEIKNLGVAVQGVVSFDAFENRPDSDMSRREALENDISESSKHSPVPDSRLTTAREIVSHIFAGMPDPECGKGQTDEELDSLSPRHREQIRKTRDRKLRKMKEYLASFGIDSYEDFLSLDPEDMLAIFPFNDIDPDTAFKPF